MKIINSVVDVLITQGDVSRDIAARLRDLYMLKHRYTGIQGYRSTGIHRYTGIQKHRYTGIQGYRDTVAQVYRDTGIL